MSADQRTPSPPRWSWTSIDAGIVALLVALSIAIFLNRGPTAYDWPAIDMAAFYERQASSRADPTVDPPPPSASAPAIPHATDESPTSHAGSDSPNSKAEVHAGGTKTGPHKISRDSTRMTSSSARASVQRE